MICPKKHNHEEEVEGGTASLAAANEVSVDTTVLSKLAAARA